MAVGYLDDSKLTNIANAIRSKTGSESTMTVDAMPTNIANIPSPINPKDVNFYDYDGTLLASYTLEEAHNLTELPPLPTAPEGYTATSWTDDLATIKSFEGPWNVGVEYTCNVDYTRIVIGIEREDELDVSFRILNVKSLDWGDGTIIQSPENGYITHTYSQLGTYNIKAYNKDGVHLFLASAFCLPSYCRDLLTTYDYFVSTFVKRIYCHKCVVLYDRPLSYYKNLESILIPIDSDALSSSYVYDLISSYISHITVPGSIYKSFGGLGVKTWACKYSWDRFNLRYSQIQKLVIHGSNIQFLSLKHASRLTELDLAISNLFEFSAESCNILPIVDLSKCTLGQNQTWYSTFYNCQALQEVIFPESDTYTIKLTGDNYIFNYCQNLCKVVLSSCVSEVKGNIFGSTNSTYKLYLKGGNTALTAAFPSSYEPAAIYVPTEYVETYKAASNWLNYASKIYGWDPS